MILTIDIETTIHPEHGPRPMYGAKGVICAFKEDTGPTKLCNLPDLKTKLDGLHWSDTVVGHNLEFDLLHAEQVRPIYRLWDTQYGEYLLSACKHMYPTLETSCDRFGVPFKKDDVIQAMFAKGHGADVIMNGDDAMKRRFVDYLRGDVEGTFTLFLLQNKELEQRNLTTSMHLGMQSLAFLTRAYAEGMPVNVGGLGSALGESTKNQTNLAAESWELMLAIEPGLKRSWDVTPGSRNALLYLFNGGEYEFDERKQVGVWKSGPKTGQPRYGHQKVHLKTTNVSDPVASLQGRDLEAWAHGLPASDMRKALAEKVVAYKLAEKHAGILAGMHKYTILSRLRPNISLCGTNTGRKASSQPNGQNLPPSARQVIESTTGHKIATFDLKQIEVVCWAVSTGDPILLQHLNNGVDIHGEAQKWIKQVHNVDVDRRNVKGIIFGSIYGGSAKTLARQSGTTEAIAKAIITYLRKTYPVAMACHEEVHRKLVPNGHRWFDPQTGSSEREAVHKTPSGMELTFRTYEGAFSYTEMRNRPIQSLASQAMMQAEMCFLQLLSTRDWKPIMQVHDEIVCVVSEWAAATELEIGAEQMTKAVKNFLKSVTGYEVRVDMEVGTGKTWFDCK